MNNVTLIGNICRDVELKQIGETTLVEFSVAVNERVKKGDEWVDEPMFVDVTVFGKQAKNCSNFLKKGSKVGVSGKLRLSQWEKDGQKRSKHSVTAHSVDFLTPKSEHQAQPAASTQIPSDAPF